MHEFLMAAISGTVQTCYRQCSVPDLHLFLPLPELIQELCLVLLVPGACPLKQSSTGSSASVCLRYKGPLSKVLSFALWVLICTMLLSVVFCSPLPRSAQGTSQDADLIRFNIFLFVSLWLPCNAV